jgi:hypothetical protein
MWTAAPDEDYVQLALPDMAPIVKAEGETIQQRFESFDSLNPWVYEALCRLTADWLARGHTRIGLKMLTEVLRWQYGRATIGDTFRLNNNFTSRYARKMLAAHPDWEGVFEVRELRAD